MRKRTLQQRWFLTSAGLGIGAVVATAGLLAWSDSTARIGVRELAITGALIVVVLVVAYQLTRAATSPIRAMTRTISALNLDEPELGTNFEGPGELNELSLAIDRVVENLLTSQATMQDEVSQRRAAQQAESASRELLREIIDLLPCVVFARSKANELIFANRAVAELYDTTLNDILLGTFTDEYGGPQPDGLLFSNARIGEQAEVWFSSPRGETHRFLVSRMPYLDGSATLVVGVDVTEEHNLQMQLQFSQRLEVIGTLAGGIAHDFNNLLTPILGYSSLLLESDLPSDAKAKIDAIDAAAQRARDVVQQILTFSRQQETIPGNTVVAVQDVVAEAARLMRASIPSSIQIHAADSDAATAVIDSNQLHQVIVNLCTNAAQAITVRSGHSDDGVIAIRIEQVVQSDPRVPAHMLPGDYVCIEIEDNGIGMPRDIENHIFEPFFTTKGVGEGSGLGLSVVHGIVTAHSGEITVESEVGRGSIFRVLLPEAGPASSQDSANANTVMLVDDETSVLKVTEELLNAQGFQVQAFSDPQVALETLRKDPSRWDVLITDHNMPKMTGAELARAVRRLSPDIPIILITGFANPEAAELEGIDHKVMKPVSGRELALVIQQSLASRHHAA